MSFLVLLFFFFFKAEDGIRDIGVTGVQTCALPILERRDGLEGFVRSRPSCPISSSRSFKYARTAVAVLLLNGTMRCLPPLPRTRTIFAVRFRSSRSRPTSSLRRRPDA